MKRLVALALAIGLVGLLAAPQAAEARGKGWKDLLIGAGLGTAVGTAMGGATTLFVSPQKLQDATFQLHYGIGAGIGFVVGVTGGALVGWLPPGEIEDEGDVEITPGFAETASFSFDMPLFLIQAVPVDEDEFEKGYFVYPVNVRF